jgi:Tfp pilus assembly protein PilV
MIRSRRECGASCVSGERGFTFAEVLIAGLLLAMSLLAMCTALLVGFSNVGSAGQSTIGVRAAAQMLEDVCALPFASISTLNNFDTDNSATQPASDPAREIARRWRYALAGDGVGWSFSTTEKTRWTDLTAGRLRIRGSGTIAVTAISATLAEVRVRVTVPGRWKPVTLTTRVAKTS